MTLDALIDDAADTLGKTHLALSVEHHLGHRRLTRRGFTTRLVVDSRGEAIDGARQRRSHAG